MLEGREPFRHAILSSRSSRPSSAKRRPACRSSSNRRDWRTDAPERLMVISTIQYFPVNSQLCDREPILDVRVKIRAY